jgi:hypothetical protein
MWMLGAGGFLLPVALVFTAVFISRELNASAKVPGLDSPVPAATAGDREGRGGPGPSDDRSDRCTEPEHAADPTCSSGSGTSGSGGGSSSSGDDGQSSTSGSSSEPSPTASPTREDNSGPGSSGSGSGSGSDDSGSGGSGSGGGDNSGPGGGDD